MISYKRVNSCVKRKTLPSPFLFGDTFSNGHPMRLGKSPVIPKTPGLAYLK
jgi:hypothetical protein